MAQCEITYKFAISIFEKIAGCVLQPKKIALKRFKMYDE
jgi:hypothetical protein